MTKVATTLFCLTFAVFVGAPGAYCSEEKSVAEWIRIIEKQKVADRKAEAADPDFASIRLGAALASAGHPGDGVADSNSAWFELDPRIKDGFEAFREFMKERGEASICAWRSQGEFPEGDEIYGYILNAVYLSKAVDLERKEKAKTQTKKRLYELPLGADEEADCRLYYQAVLKDGYAAMRTGYQTAALSAGDIEAIRLPRIALGRQVVKTGYLPSQLGVTPYRPYKHGEPATDFCIREFEATLQRQDYVDDFQYAYYLDFKLRPEGVLEFLRIMDGHEWRDDGTGKNEYLPKIPAETPEGYVRLSSFQGEKPVLLYFSNPYDWVGPGLLGEMEPLYQAYRDRVQFYYVAHIIGDWHHGLGHEYSINAMASKAKVMYMVRPFMSIPCLLDDLSCPAKNAYHRSASAGMVDWTMKPRMEFLDGAWPAYTADTPIRNRPAGFVQGSCFLIDKRGRVAASFAEGYQWDPNRANLYERSIRSLLVRGGECAAEAVGKECFIGEWRVSVPKRITLTLAKATVVAVDVGKGEIAADADLSTGTKRYVLRVGKHARLGSGGTPFALADLKPGTKISAEFYADDYLGEGITVTEEDSKQNSWDRALCKIAGANGALTAVVRGNGRGGWTHPRGVGYFVESDGGWAAVEVRAVLAQLGDFDREKQQKANAELVLCGRITAVDPETRVVTVRPTVPKSDDLIGYRLWQHGGQATARHFPSVKAGAALQRRKAVAAWIDALAKGPVRRDVLLDDGVEIIIDGTWDHAFAELKIGDLIGVRHTVIQDDGELIRPDWVRISRPL